jgi:PKD repeat protein
VWPAPTSRAPPRYPEKARADTAQQTITTTAPIKAPVAKLTVTPSTGTTPLSVTADASASTDPQGQALTYAFDFGDGATFAAQGNPVATHSYTTAGTFAATVTVRNTSGLTDTAQQTITITAPQPGYVARRAPVRRRPQRAPEH